MSKVPTPGEREPRRRWPIDEKRRIVELTLRPGASLRAIAREQGVHATSLSHWRKRYQFGELVAQLPKTRGARAQAPLGGFLPITVDSANAPQTMSKCTVAASIVHIGLPSGVTLRIETSLDVCTLIAQLR